MTAARLWVPPGTAKKTPDNGINRKLAGLLPRRQVQQFGPCQTPDTGRVLSPGPGRGELHLPVIQVGCHLLGDWAAQRKCHSVPHRPGHCLEELSGKSQHKGS